MTALELEACQLCNLGPGGLENGVPKGLDTSHADEDADGLRKGSDDASDGT